MELIKFNHTTKEQRSEVVKEMMNEVLNGRVNPLELHLRLKAAEEVIKALTSIPAYKGILLDEAAKYGKSFQYQTAKVEVKEVGVKYDYCQCGNSTLADLYCQAEAISARIKELETYHKGLPASGIEVLDPVSGELEKHYPPAKTSTTSVAFTLK